MHTLKLLERSFGICKLPAATTIPAWACDGFFSATSTESELSIVCEECQIPDNIERESDWRCLKVVGQLSFDLVGVVAKLTSCLAVANISVFVISTYNTDYCLVKEEYLDLAVETLKQSGYHFDDHSP